MAGDGWVYGSSSTRFEFDLGTLGRSRTVPILVFSPSFDMGLCASVPSLFPFFSIGRRPLLFFGLGLSALPFRCPPRALLFCVVTVKPRQHFILFFYKNNKTKRNSNIKC
ncbi:hypothetical protein ACFX1X_004350 [Malus domestica]